MELARKPVVMDFTKSPATVETNNTDWRKDVNSMPQRWAAILKTSLEQFPHDITFSVGGESISCHKIVLSVASPLFEDLISAAGKIGQNVINVTGVDFTAFKNIIQHVYQDETAIEEKDLAATMSAAHLCKIPELEDFCAKKLQNTLSAKNVVSLFQEADHINNGQLHESVCGFLIKNFDKIVKSDDYLRFTERHLCEFLKENDFQAPPEIDVFKSLIRWGEHQCGLQRKEKTSENLKGVLDGVLRHLRMSSISPEEFFSVIEPSNLFTLEEGRKLFRYFWLQKDNKDANLLLQELNLSTLPRSLQDSEKIVDLFSDFTLYCEFDASQYIDYNWGVSFKIDWDEGDQPVYLKGVALAGRPSKPTENITMKIGMGQHDSWKTTGPFLCEMETSYTAEAKKTIMIDLNQSVVPNMNYRVYVCPIVGGVAGGMNPKKDVVLYNETDGLTKPIKLTISEAYCVSSLKFSNSE